MLWLYDFMVEKNLEHAEDLYHIVQQISLSSLFSDLHLASYQSPSHFAGFTLAYLDKTIWRRTVSRAGVGPRKFIGGGVLYFIPASFLTMKNRIFILMDGEKEVVLVFSIPFHFL